MIYGSVCSGIEAASVAWHPLGWKPAFFSEIEAFPRAVLSHHFPEVPLHGDFTTIQAGDYRPIDLLVGGTPCQSFSIAGLRKGLDDDRGNLALEYLRLADRLRPQWLVWENVPGVLSSNGGRDFGAFLGGLVELGYGFAYRVLDAQFFGVAQRRRRVFVVGYLGDWRPAAAVLFERHSLQGHPAPRRGQGPDATGSTGDGVARCLTAGEMKRGDWETCNFVAALTATGVGTCGADDNQAQAGHLVPTAYSIMPMNSGTDYKARETDIAQPGMTTPVGGNQGGDYVVQPMAFDTAQITSAANATRVSPELPASTLAKGSRMHVAYEPYTLAIRGREGGADLEHRQDGTSNAILTPSGGRAGIGVGAVATFNDDGTARTLTARHDSSPCADRGPDVVAYGFDWQSGGDCRGLDLKPTVQLQAHQTPASLSAMRVRRLTPSECEALQGLPRGWTQVPYRNKPAADGPRYKAIGNSFAVPVVRWIGQQIDIAASGLV